MALYTFASFPANKGNPMKITPGIYQTRNGNRALIRAVNARHDIQENGFAAQGSVERMFRGKMQFRGYRIWKLTGEYMAIGQHPLDIIARLSD